MTATLVLALLAAAASVALVVIFLRDKGLAARLAALEADAKRLQEEQRAALDKEKKSVKLLEQRTEELGEMKKELGGLKKKQFAQAEEWKKKQTELEEKLERTERALTAKPAFGEPEPPRPVRPKVEAKPPREEPRPPQATLPPANADTELGKRVGELERDKRELETEVAQLRNELRGAQAEVRGVRRRVENYRRIDAVSKNKLELMADKLAQVGRSYYEAVSELAALKGEVVPPPSKLVVEARAQAEAVQAELAREEAAQDAEGGSRSDATDEPRPRDTAATP